MSRIPHMSALPDGHLTYGHGEPRREFSHSYHNAAETPRTLHLQEGRSHLRTPPMSDDMYRPSHEVPSVAIPSGDPASRPILDSRRSGNAVSLPSISSWLADASRPSSSSHEAYRLQSAQSALPRTPLPGGPPRQFEASRSSQTHYSFDKAPPPSPRTEYSARPTEISRLPSIYHDARYSPPQTSRASPSAASWSPRSDAHVTSRPDYFSRDSSALRTHHESHSYDSHIQAGPQLYRTDTESRSVLRSAALPALNYPQESATSSSLRSPVVKDTLGPKIWAEGQFLPRFVRQSDVPGEGQCFFYDDGTHCKTHIDGEPVNAHWGVTKAGKPRKRLAIACLTCREKKIKCDPEYPRCLQCEKFGRICRFKNAPRGQQGSPEPSPADEELKRSRSSRSLSPGPLDERDSKRQRRGSDHSASTKSEYKYESTSPYVPSSSERALTASNALSAQPREPPTLKWPNNPYAADPVLVMELSRVFFSNIASTAYSFIPEEAYFAWLSLAAPKSTDDILLMHAMLAVATIFSTSADKRKLGTEFAKAARHAERSGKLSLQYVQARLLFAIYYESTGKVNVAWDFLGSAIRAAIGIKLHLEPQPSSERTPMDMPPCTHAETRRRTFWSLYIMDRLGSFRNGRLSNITTDDIFLRLPCDNLAYTQDKVIVNPFFCRDIDLAYNRTGTFGVMAYLVVVATIYSEVMAMAYRSERGFKTCAPERFVEESTARLEKWLVSVPPCITMNKDNIMKTTDFGLFGTFASMHIVHRATQLKLETAFPSSGSSKRVVKVATAFLRDMGMCAKSENHAIDVNSKACGILPPVAGRHMIEAMKLLNSSADTRHVVDFKQATTVLAELAQTWPCAVEDLVTLAAERGIARE